MWKFLFYISAFVFMLIVLATYLNILPFQQFTQQYDKLLHFLLFGGVSWLGFRAFPKQYHFQSLPIPAFPFWMTLFAIAEELFQNLYPHRTFSLLDLLANFCGIWIFYLADRLIYCIRKKPVQDN